MFAMITSFISTNLFHFYKSTGDETNWYKDDTQEFLDVQGSWVHFENESTSGFQQQKLERFYL
jgi:hypothetical protein